MALRPVLTTGASVGFKARAVARPSMFLGLNLGIRRWMLKATRVVMDKGEEQWVRDDGVDEQAGESAIGRPSQQ